MYIRGGLPSLSEGWPDFWIRGKKIDLIDLINTVNLIKKIETIDAITNITTLETINTVNTVDTINTIDKIKVIHDARIVPNFIQNGSFRTGDLSGWPAYSANVYVEYDTEYRDYVCVFPNQYDYIGQYLPPLYGEETRIKVRYRHEIDGGEIRIMLIYTDATTENYDFTASTGGAWYDAIVEPTKKVPLAAIMIYNRTDGSELRITGCEMLRKQLVYQAEKDRTITDINATASLHSFDVSASSSGNNAIWTPASGKAIRLKFVQYESDADVEVGLRFGDTGSLFARRVTAGVMALNLIGCNIQGGTDEVLNLYVGGAVNVKGFVLGEEV